jgi:proteasome lid subunit RPN8/RPN11
MSPLATGSEAHPPTAAQRMYSKQMENLKREGERQGWYHSGPGRRRGGF